jgi:cytohesin
MDLSPPPPPPPQADDPIITQFKPVYSQWELNDNNINRIDPETGRTILHNYCRHINTTPLEVWRYLIEVKGCDINVQDNNQDTPIHHVLDYFDPRNGGDIAVLTYLINQNGVDVNIKSKKGFTLLHRACEKMNKLPLDVFKILIETHGCDVNAQDKYNDTPLHNTIGYSNIRHSRDIAVLLYLFSQTKVNVNIKGQFGHTLLHRACTYINILPLDVFKVLIETHGADVNAQDKYNDTPLHNALRNFIPDDDGAITALTYLIRQKNVDVNIKDKNGNTLLHLACDKINTLPLDIFKLLIETHGADVNALNNDNDTPLHNAIRCFDPNDGDNINVLTYLLSQNDVNGNIVGEHGFTLLHMACKHIKRLPLDIFKLLIESHGADVNVQDNNNGHPLHNAFDYFNPSDNDNIAVLTYLLTRKGIDGNAKGKNGDTFLHMVCKHIKRFSLEIFQHLIETVGCDVNALNNDNDTPIHVAFRSFNPNKGRYITVLTYLLSQKGIDGNIKDKYGYTLLQRACKHIKRFSLEIFQNLIKKGDTDINVRDNSNDTPLHHALEHLNPHKGGDINVWAYVINQQNLNVNIKDSNGHTLLHLACICNISDLNNHMDSDDDYMHSDDNYMHSDDYTDSDMDSDDDYMHSDNYRDSAMDSDDDYMDSDDDYTDSEGNLDNHREAKAETFLCQIVEAIAERCVQQVLGETNME